MTNKQLTSTIRCPYMPQHVMHIDSLLTHLNRCKATNKHLFRTCLYNSLHVIPRQAYEQHVKRCEDAAKFNNPNDEDWEDQNHAPKIISYQNHIKSRSQSDHSNEDWGYSQYTSSAESGYGYYKYADQPAPYGNEYQSQYNNVEAASAYQLDQLSYLKPASTTPNPLKKKKGNKTVLQQQKPFYYAQYLNQSMSSSHDKNKSSKFVVVSDKDTYEQSQEEKKLKLQNNQQIKIIQKTPKTEDEQLLYLLNQMESADNKLSMINNYKGDQFGNGLLKQTEIYKNNTNITIKGGDGVGALTRF